MTRQVPPRSGALMARMIADYERQVRRRMLLALILEAGVFLFLLVGVVGCLYLLGMATQP